MEYEDNSTKFKVLIGVLTLLLIGLAVYTVSLYNDSKNTVSGLEQQKVEIQSELEAYEMQLLRTQRNLPWVHHVQARDRAGVGQGSSHQRHSTAG